MPTAVEAIATGGMLALAAHKRLSCAPRGLLPIGLPVWDIVTHITGFKSCAPVQVCCKSSKNSHCNQWQAALAEDWFCAWREVSLRTVAAAIGRV